jgi:hypothetical protein
LAPHLDCDSDEARVARAIAAASLAIWGVGFPLVLGLLINRKSGDPKYSFVIVSCGYKPARRYWEAWECLKKFAILLIITFLNETLDFSPVLAATVLVLFLCGSAIVFAVSDPFVSSLVNKAHLACDVLVVFVLLSGLLSTATAGRWPREVHTMSVAVVSFMGFVLSVLFPILVIEAGSILRPGGALHAIWTSFLETNQVAAVVGAARRLSSAMSSVVGFSAAIVPESATPSAGQTRSTLIEVSSVVADAVSASPGLFSLSNDLAQPARLQEQYTSTLQRMREDIASLVSIALLLDADDDDKQQLEKCGISLEMLAESSRVCRES